MSSIEQPEQTETMDLATAQRVEQDKITRRAALRKLGFGAGMAAFGLLGVDDFARMVGKRMERMAGDNKVAEQVAKEFQNAGVVMADSPGYPSGGCSGTGGCSGSPSTCQHCDNQVHLDHCYCVAVYSPDGSRPNPTQYQHCLNQAQYNYEGCSCCCYGSTSGIPTSVCPAYGLTQPQGCNC